MSAASLETQQTVFCVSGDLPPVLSEALTLLRVEKPPVLHSSDSATCASLHELWRKPSGCSSSHLHNHKLRFFAKQGEFILWNPPFSSPEQMEGREHCD